MKRRTGTRGQLVWEVWPSERKKTWEDKNDEGRDGERDQSSRGRIGSSLKGTAREVEVAASAITRSPELRTES